MKQVDVCSVEGLPGLSLLETVYPWTHRELVVSRSAVAALLAIAPVLAAMLPDAEASDLPPSSLDPEARAGTITFEHRQRRVVACSAEKKGGELTCEPSDEPTDAGTSLTLVPVKESGALGQQDRRSSVSVRFESDPKPPPAEVQVSPGLWEIKWSGLKKRVALRVAEQDEFSVGLSTVSGACRKQGTRCVVNPAPVKRKVDVPASRRVQ